MRLKKKHRKAFGYYVRWIADEMGLRDWRFEIEWRDPEEDRHVSGHVRGASCDPVPGRRMATLGFDDGIRKQDPEELRETVVHELVHCHLAPLWAQLRQDLLSPFGQETYDAFLASVERNMEFGVDALSVALAKHMPLIDWNNTGEEYE